MTTELQKLALDALDQLGPMTQLELETACLVAPKSVGGFRSSLIRLFERELVALCDSHVLITGAGVRAVEDYNIAEGWTE